MKLLLENSNEASHTQNPKKTGSNLGEYPAHEGSSEPQTGAGAYPCSQIGEASHKVIHHPGPPNNEIYAGAGRPCKCGCFFQCSHDYNLHRQICGGKNWRPSNYGNGKILPVKDDPELAQALIRQGKTIIGNYTYRISANRQWLICEPLSGENEE